MQYKWEISDFWKLKRVLAFWNRVSTIYVNLSSNQNPQKSPVIWKSKTGWFKRTKRVNLDNIGKTFHDGSRFSWLTWTRRYLKICELIYLSLLVFLPLLLPLCSHWNIPHLYTPLQTTGLGSGPRNQGPEWS